jgi:hypothetical protein
MSCVECPSGYPALPERLRNIIGDKEVQELPQVLPFLLFKRRQINPQAGYNRHIDSGPGVS